MKIIRDPIYNQIEVDELYVKVLDSVYFQRLRNIIQTSYSALYPSALHNRFAHSLGVYNLGKLAFSKLIENSTQILSSLSRTKKEVIRDTFILACLCHDLGHSPFSHTGERFYNRSYITEQLKKKINKTTYTKDLNSEGGIVGKEHEIMSALLAINVFEDLIAVKYQDFFARCIIGLKYKTNLENIEIKLKNACIELLNSNIMDVDKLDYLIRDSYMSGYDSVVIDYKRLLSGISIHMGEFPIKYNKNSLSVLESVLTANDIARRWVQAHPAILYESFLVQTIIREINTKYGYGKQSLLDLTVLTEKGKDIVDHNNIRLLSDADILFLAKQCYEESDSVKEYYNRDCRRHPIWKSEAEYKYLFGNTLPKESLEILQGWEALLLSGEYGVYSLNEIFYEKLNDEAKRLERLAKESDKLDKTIVQKREKIKKELTFLTQIRDYFLKKDMMLDLVIVTQKQFKSNIYKKDFKNLPIDFAYSENSITEMHEVTHIPLDTAQSEDFFYLFYRRENDKTIDVEDFAKELRRAAIV